MKLFSSQFSSCSFAGFNLAIIVLPQAIAFSILAGVPPHFGLYCAIYGVLIVAFINPSYRFHGGPNSSMSVAISVALLPMAPQFGADYMGYVLSLAVMIGAIQLVFATINPLSRLMDFMSEAVASGIIFGIGFFLILKSLASFGGLPLNTQVEWHLIISWHTLLAVIEYGNPFAIEVGFVTLISALSVQMVPMLKKWYLIIGLVCGTAYAEYLNSNFGGLMITQLEQVGNLSLPLVMPSIPTFTPDSLPDLLQLMPSALAIALLGIFQTVAIVRRSRRITGDFVSTRQATFADAIANIAAGFISALPGCGSFNRVAMMHAFDVRSRGAAILSAVFLAMLILLAKDLLAIIPLPAMSAMIMLVGANMLRYSDIKHHFKSRIETVVFISAFLAIHVFGLLNAALIGAGFAFLNWVWHKSHPKVKIKDNIAFIHGDMYYASVAVVEPIIASLMNKFDEVVIDLTHTSHLDAEASRWLAKVGVAQDYNVSVNIAKKQIGFKSTLTRIGEIDLNRLTVNSVQAI